MKKFLPFIIGVAIAIVATIGIFLPSKEISFGATTIAMPNQGGTGTSTKPTTGQILMGNASGTYSVVATSSLGIATSYWSESGSVLTPLNTADAINVASTTGGYKYANTRFITFANNNLAIGESALESATGQYNIGIGATALYLNTTGTYNVAIGLDSMRNNTGGNYNYANGYQALYSNSTGQYNTAVGGSAALRSNLTGSYNVAMGDSACYTNETGNNNTCVGYNSDVSSAGLSSSTAIGYNAKVAANGTIILGNVNTKVGIASTTANYTLDVAGSINASTNITANGAYIGVSSAAAKFSSYNTNPANYNALFTQNTSSPSQSGTNIYVSSVIDNTNLGYIGVSSFAQTTAGTSTNIYLYKTAFQNAGATVVNNYGYYATNPTFSSGVVTNNYGFYAEQMTGATNNWAIYSEGQNYLGGALSTQVDTITVSTTLDTNYHTVLASSTATIVVTLPTPVGISGRQYRIKQVGSGNVDIITTAGKIDGQTTSTLNSQYLSVDIVAQDNNWWIY